MKNARELTRVLVSIESSNPGTYEDALADYLEAQLKAVLPVFGKMVRQEYKDKNCKENQERLRPVIMATLPGENIEKELVFICHMDTVPIGENWTMDPLKGQDMKSESSQLFKHRIYGRGSCDMKSGLACAFTAFATACQKAKENGKFKNTLKLILTSDEEADMQGVEHVIKWNWVKKNALIMDTEPTNKEIQTAHKGRLWYELICNGKVAHASKTEEGANAILGMGYAMTKANELFKSLNDDEFCGASSLTFGRIEGGTQLYQVPGRCHVSVDMRLVPPYDVGVGKRILLEAADFAKDMVQGASFEVHQMGNRPAVPHNKDSKLLHLLCRSVERITGEMPKITVFPGYTDTAVIASGIGCNEILSYGPGDLALAHKPDEYVEISEIERCEKVYMDLVFHFLKI